MLLQHCPPVQEVLQEEQALFPLSAKQLGLFLLPTACRRDLNTRLLLRRATITTKSKTTKAASSTHHPHLLFLRLLLLPLPEEGEWETARRVGWRKAEAAAAFPPTGTGRAVFCLQYPPPFLLLNFAAQQGELPTRLHAQVAALFLIRRVMLRREKESMNLQKALRSHPTGLKPRRRSLFLSLGAMPGGTTKTTTTTISPPSLASLRPRRELQQQRRRRPVQ